MFIAFPRSDALSAGFMLSTWECVLVNLGHVYRKAQQWQAAIDCYTKALGLSPGQASTYSALAYTYHLQVSFLARKALVFSDHSRQLPSAICTYARQN